MPTKTTRRSSYAPSLERDTGQLLRTSERLALNRCRQRWDWGYNDRLRPKREAPALRFGTLIHKALEAYYNPVQRKWALGRSLPDLFEHFYQKELAETEKEWRNWRDEDDEWHSYEELGVVMCEGYVKHFAPMDKEYIVLAVEQRFEAPIIVPKGENELLSPSPTIYVGTLDRILFHMPSKRLLLGDYKTTKSDPTSTKHLILDEQAGAYWAYAPTWLATGAPEKLRRAITRRTAHLPAAYRKAVQEWRFDGIEYDFLKKALPDERPMNEEGLRLNKPLKPDLIACCQENALPWKKMTSSQLVEVIEFKLGKGYPSKLGKVSEKQPGPLFHREPVYRDEGDRQRVLRRIYEDAVEIGDMRQGDMAIKKSPDRFICIGCPFIDMCELHEAQASGWEEFREFAYEKQDTYSAYNIDADELE